MKKLICPILLLLVGGLIYILWRGEQLLMFSFFKGLGINPYLIELRKPIFIYKFYLPDWIIYSLPNSLWYLSGLLIFEFIWLNKKSFEKGLWILTFSIFAIGAEILQGVGIVPGTFDWADIILMLMALLTYLYLVEISKKGITKYEEK